MPWCRPGCRSDSWYAWSTTTSTRSLPTLSPHRRLRGICRVGNRAGRHCAGHWREHWRARGRGGARWAPCSCRVPQPDRASACTGGTCSASCRAGASSTDPTWRPTEVRTAPISHLTNQYASRCPHCGAPGVAEWFSWDRDAAKPYAKRALPALQRHARGPCGR